MTGHRGQYVLFPNSSQRIVHRIANDVRSAQHTDNRTVLHNGHFLQFMLRQKRACLLERCVLRNAHDTFRGNMRNGERNKLFENVWLFAASMSEYELVIAGWHSER